MSDDAPQTWKPTTIVGTILCRIIVPIWILTGATFKFIEATPGLLPRKILQDADKLNIDLDWLLASLIAIEIVAALVILLLGRVARVAAASMLAVFCIVLIREIAAGNTNCGCLGANSPSPWVMLGIDGTMLLGVLFLTPYRFTRMDNRFWPPIAVAVLSLAGAFVTFHHLIPWSSGETTPLQTNVRPSTETETPAPDPNAPLPLPSYWYSSDVASLEGTPWRSFELFRFMDPPPAGLDEGMHYVVFYGRTCEHCEAMFREDLAPNPGLAQRVTAIEVPVDTDVMTSPDAWALPATECRHDALPLGVNWIITTPLALRIEDGLIRCAEEGAHETCFELPGHE